MDQVNCIPVTWCRLYAGEKRVLFSTSQGKFIYIAPVTIKKMSQGSFTEQQKQKKASKMNTNQGKH